MEKWVIIILIVASCKSVKHDTAGISPKSNYYSFRVDSTTWAKAMKCSWKNIVYPNDKPAKSIINVFEGKTTIGDTTMPKFFKH